jgi:hypothetical protein
MKTLSLTTAALALVAAATLSPAMALAQGAPLQGRRHRVRTLGVPPRPQPRTTSGSTTMVTMPNGRGTGSWSGKQVNEP